MFSQENCQALSFLGGVGRFFRCLSQGCSWYMARTVFDLETGREKKFEK